MSQVHLADVPNDISLGNIVGGVSDKNPRPATNVRPVDDCHHRARRPFFLRQGDLLAQDDAERLDAR